LAYAFTIIWNEIAEAHDNVPVLCFSLPLGTQPEYFQSDVPGGIQKRPGEFLDYPGLRYTAAVNGSDALAFITDCKYGYRGTNESLSVTLINTAEHPDPFPERGEHTIRLWITPTTSDPKTLAETAGAYCRSVNIVSGGKHNGKLPLEKEAVKFEAASTVLSSLGSADKNMGLVRGYETAGKTDRVKLTMPNEIKEARLIDLDGKTIGGDIKASGYSVTFEVAPNRIFGVLVSIA
jgi:alpha-mannosidase